MAPGFGLPLPAEGAAAGWWLRPKGVRDVVAGVLVPAVVSTGGHRALGLVLLIQAFVPVGDMTTVLAATGWIATALGLHGMTAAVKTVAAAVLLLMVSWPPAHPAGLILADDVTQPRR